MPSPSMIAPILGRQDEIHTADNHSTMSTIDYNTTKGSQLESEAEKTDSIGGEDVSAAVPVEHGQMTQYELANDPHRYVQMLTGVSGGDSGSGCSADQQGSSNAPCAAHRHLWRYRRRPLRLYRRSPHQSWPAGSAYRSRTVVFSHLGGFELRDRIQHTPPVRWRLRHCRRALCPPFLWYGSWLECMSILLFLFHIILIYSSSLPSSPSSASSSQRSMSLSNTGPTLFTPPSSSRSASSRSVSSSCTLSDGLERLNSGFQSPRCFS